MHKSAPTFEKEMLLETEIVKNGQTYSITSDFLQNCVVQYRRMKKSGMKVNVHAGHTHTPETKRGEVLDIYLKKRNDGRVGLFGRIAFLPHLSKQTIQTLVSNDVSVELPQELYDAKGNLYPFPVQRVAITPDPAVSGMQPFVQQRDTAVSVPFLTLSIDTLNKENTNMENEDLLESQHEEAGGGESYEPSDEGNDGGNGQQTVVSVTKKGSFLDSQLAKTLFDTCAIDPGEYGTEDELMNELTTRLADIITLQARALAALRIDDDDPNRFELFTSRITDIIEILERYDENDDGELDNQEAQTAVQTAPSETIDGAIGNLEKNDEALKLSLNNLQKKYDASADVIRQLVAQNRKLELDGMLQAGILNKAAHQKAVQKFVLKLSLNDGFNDFIDGAKTNARHVGQSQTAVQQPAKKVDATESWVAVGKKIAAPYKRSNQ